MPKRTTQSKLFNVIEEFGTTPPGFALLLGAGASVAGGVKSAREMIEDWREKHYRLFSNSGESKEEHLGKQSWYNAANEYGRLFETLYDLPAQRREYIESCIQGTSPSWGHTYLANMLTCGYFNILLTTNFDDLLSDVCFKFPSVPKPIVCAHDSRIDSIRLLSSRPKIVKLHGDFLFDDIKNTSRETDDLGRNMREKVLEFAREYGLIVIGYSGRDNSVMTALHEALREPRSFRNGIYWCVLEEDNTSEKTEELSQDSRFHFVEIKGFDEFMAELNRHLNLGLPKELSSPYEALGESLQVLLREAKRSSGKTLHPLIEKDQNEVKKALQKIPPQVVPEELDFERISGFEFRVGKVAVRLPVPFGPIGEAHEKAGNTEEALRFLALQIRHAPNPRAFTYVFELLKAHGLVSDRYDGFERLLKASMNMFKREYREANDLALSLMQLEKWSDARWVLDCGERFFREAGDTNPILGAYLKLNKIQIDVHKGNRLRKDQLRELEKIANIDSPYTKMGANILLERWEEAELSLEKCLALGPAGRIHIKDWPIVSLLKPHLKRKSVVTKLKKAR